MKLNAFMTPVELISLAGIEPQRNEGLRWRSRAIGAPRLHKAMDAVVGAIVTSPSQFFEQPDCRTTFASRQFFLGFENRRQRLDP